MSALDLSRWNPCGDSHPSSRRYITHRTRWDLGARPVDGEGPLPRFQPTQSGCANGGGLLKGEKESRDDANARVAATLVKVHEAPAHDPRASDDPARRRAPVHTHTRHHRVPGSGDPASSSLSAGPRPSRTT